MAEKLLTGLISHDVHIENKNIKSDSPKFGSRQFQLIKFFKSDKQVFKLCLYFTILGKVQ